jgi:mRNA interferase RelE/StbE
MRPVYANEAREQLRKLPRSVQSRIIKKVLFYAAQPNPLSFAKPLTGYNAYRFRIGDYRAIFETADDTISILRIVKHEGAYRDL